jgi:hypothetical protein
MISIKQNHFKIILLSFLLYIVGLSLYSFLREYQNRNEILKTNQLLELQLENISGKNKILIEKIAKKADEISKLEESYDTEKNVTLKLERIFKRLSLEYKLTLISLNKLCIDHYIIVAKVDSNNQEIIESFRNILSHLGRVKQSDKNKNILYIDYIMEKNKGKNNG